MGKSITSAVASVLASFFLGEFQVRVAILRKNQKDAPALHAPVATSPVVSSPGNLREKDCTPEHNGLLVDAVPCRQGAEAARKRRLMSQVLYQSHGLLRGMGLTVENGGGMLRGDVQTLELWSHT